MPLIVGKYGKTCSTKESPRESLSLEWGVWYIKSGESRQDISLSSFEGEQSQRSSFQTDNTSTRVLICRFRKVGVRFAFIANCLRVWTRLLTSQASSPRENINFVKMMAVAAAQKNREMFAIKKSFSIEVSVSLIPKLRVALCQSTLSTAPRTRSILS